MSKPDLTMKALVFVFQSSAVVFFGGFALTLVAMGLAYVMPIWWQHVFMFLAIPTLVSLPICFATGIAAAIRNRTATQETT